MFLRAFVSDPGAVPVETSTDAGLTFDTSRATLVAALGVLFGKMRSAPEGMESHLLSATLCRFMVEYVSHLNEKAVQSGHSPLLSGSRGKYSGGMQNLLAETVSESLFANKKTDEYIANWLIDQLEQPHFRRMIAVH